MKPSLNPIEQARNNKLDRNRETEASNREYEATVKQRFQTEVERYDRLVREDGFSYDEIEVFEWGDEQVAGMKFDNGIGHQTFLFFYPDRYAIVEAGQQCDVDPYVDDDGVTVHRLVEPEVDTRTPYRAAEDDAVSYRYDDPADADTSRFKWHEMDIQQKELSPTHAQQVSLMARSLKLLSDAVELKRL